MERYKNLKRVLSKIPQETAEKMNTIDEFDQELPNQQLAGLGGKQAIDAFLALNQDLDEENQELQQELNKKYNTNMPKFQLPGLPNISGPVSKMASKSLTNQLVNAKEGDDLIEVLAKLAANKKSSLASGASIYEQLGKSPSGAINETIDKIKLSVPGLKIQQIDPDTAAITAALKGQNIQTMGEFFPEQKLLKAVIDKNSPYQTLSTLEHEGLHAKDNLIASAKNKSILDDYSDYFNVNNKEKAKELKKALSGEKLSINKKTKDVNVNELYDLYNKLAKENKFNQILKIENALKNPHFFDKDIKNLELEKILDHYRQMDSNLNEREFKTLQKLFPKIKKP